MDPSAPKDRPPTERASHEALREEVPARRPYSPPSVLHADEIRFETQLACANTKTIVCTTFGCIQNGS